MAFNPNNPKHMKRLGKAVNWSRHRLSPFRQTRVEALEQYVGAHYSDSGIAQVPINFIELAVSIFKYKLAARAPQVLITTTNRELKPTAARIQAVTNALMEHEINLEHTLQMAVLNAFVGQGIVKAGITDGALADVAGFLHDMGQPFADVVSLDDWVHDMSVKRWERIGYCGDKYRLPFEHVKEYEGFDKRARAALQFTPRSAVDDVGEQTADRITTGDSPMDDGEFEDMIDIWDLWLPRENLFVTVAAHDSEDPFASRPLMVSDYDGPETGPYHRLSFHDVPDQTMPLAPVSLWRDMHDLGNAIFRKLADQAENQKEVAAGRDRGDAERMAGAGDMQFVRIDDPQNLTRFRWNGPDPQNLGFLVQVRDFFSYFQGNLDALGGLGPSADTLGQDQIIQSQVSDRVTDMQDRTTAFAAKIARDLTFWYYTDPVRTFTARRKIQGVEVPVTLSPEDRENDFWEYNTQVALYSMQNRNPGQRIQTIVNAMNQLVAPYLPVMLQQGIAPDFRYLMRTVGQYANMSEEFENLFTSVGDQPQDSESARELNRQSPQTTRTNVRVNRPGATRQGRDAALTQQLFGGRVQEAERATGVRTVG